MYEQYPLKYCSFNINYTSDVLRLVSILLWIIIKSVSIKILADESNDDNERNMMETNQLYKSR